MYLPENNSEKPITFTFDLLPNSLSFSNYTRSLCSSTLCIPFWHIWGVSFLQNNSSHIWIVISAFLVLTIIRNYLIVKITPLHFEFCICFVLHKYKYCNNKIGVYFLSHFKEPLCFWIDWSMLRIQWCIFIEESCLITQKEVSVFFSVFHVTVAKCC